jgi:hypothetical protein
MDRLPIGPQVGNLPHTFSLLSGSAWRRTTNTRELDYGEESGLVEAVGRQASDLDLADLVRRALAR